MYDPYENLANLIILQAVTDYRKALKFLKKHKDDEDALETKRDCEDFFQSEWFRLLSSLDPDYLLQGIARLEI